MFTKIRKQVNTGTDFRHWWRLSAVMKYAWLPGVALVLLACGTEGGVVEEMESMASAERAANERASRELVVDMSLETMFPDPKVRALASAAGKGQISKIDKLVEQGANVNARGGGGAPPLFWSMRNIRGFERLLELGADPNAVFDGGAVMHWATLHDDDEFLILALEYGGNPNVIGTTRQITPLFEVMGPDNKSKIPILLDAGADMNFQAHNGETPMMVAAGLGQFDTVFELLERGADYQLRNNYTNGTLMDRIASRRTTMDPNNELTRWMEKVIDWLAGRGTPIPEWKDPAVK